MVDQRAEGGEERERQVVGAVIGFMEEEALDFEERVEIMIEEIESRKDPAGRMEKEVGEEKK